MTVADWLRWRPTAAVNAAKTAAGILLAWVLVLWFQWPDAFLAPMTVLFLQTPYLGASLRKGLMRVFGTLAGALLVLLLLAGLIQERWALLGALSLVIGLSVYQIRASRYGYAWFMLAITATIIAADAFGTPELAFQLVVYRTSEAVLGILIVLVINGLFWPRTAGGVYRQRWAESLEQPVEYLRALAGALRSSDAGAIPSAPPQLFGASVRLREILTAAALDSSGFRRLRRTYEAQIRQLSAVTGALLALVETLRLATEGENPILHHSHRAPLAQTLDDLAEALAACRAPAAQEQSPQARMERPEPLAIDVPALSPRVGPAVHRDSAFLQAITHQCRMLTTAITRLRQATAAIAAERPLPAAALPTEVALPLSVRLQANLPHAIVAMLAFWLSLLIWFQWQWPPSGFMGALMAVVIVGIDTLNDRPAEQPGRRVFLGALAGALLTAPLYLLVLPRLDGWVELLLVLLPFYYLGLYFFHAHDKPHNLVFLGLLLMAILMPRLAPEQSYSLIDYLNSALSILSGYALGLLTLGIGLGQRPHALLRRHLQALLTSIAHAQQALAERRAPDFIAQMQRAEQHQRELLQRLSQVAPLAFDPCVPHNDQARIDALVAAAQSLSIRARALQRARAGFRHQPNVALPASRQGPGMWHRPQLGRRYRRVFAVLLLQLRVRLDHPQQPIGLAALDRLRAWVRPELTHLNTAAPTVDPLYPLIIAGYYLGVARALREFTAAVEAIDWAAWRQPRF
ncbi:FUSC family protein [Rhabdochromatium marinum]|uniref:FUSC family protein n=1 Tax=Rhabdochromatium marinum TaxID=48729 RepID=UPI001908F056|nr:FUSC family protein [Rhabdochromatium marinum]MBK1647968.1 hypothetical protein [Rhabdochromatium marinum]